MSPAPRGPGRSTRRASPTASRVVLLPGLVPGLLVLLLALTASLAGCSPDLEQSLESAESAAADLAPPVADQVDPVTARELIDEGAVVVDVRDAVAYAEGHLPDAVHLDLQSTDFLDELDDLDPDATYVVYGRSAELAAAAAAQMLGSGFADVVNAGSFAALEAAGAALD